MGSSENGEPVKFDPNFKGPLKNRSCTDIIFLILFIVCIAAMIGVAILAFVRGDPMKLIYPADSNGNMCGSGKFATKPNLLYFDLMECAKAGVSVAIMGCPTPSVYLFYPFQICVETCPTINWAYIQTMATETAGVTAEGQRNFFCIDGFDARTTSMPLNDIMKNEKCAAYTIESTPIVRRCIPSFIANAANSVANIDASNGQALVNSLNETMTEAGLKTGVKYLNYMLQGLNYLMNVIDDIKTTWWLILSCIALAAIVSFIWIVIMRWISGIMVWFSMFAFLILFGFGTYYCLNQYIVLLNLDTSATFTVSTDVASYANYKETWLAGGIICGIFLLIMLILVIFLRNRIKIAIAIIKETSRAVGKMMFTLIFPIFPFIFQLIILAFWVGSAVYIQTMGSPQFSESPLNVNTSLTGTVDAVTAAIPCTPDTTSTTGSMCNFLKYGGSEYIYVLQIYQLFMFLWLINFVAAFGQMTLAGAFAGYYWAFNKPKDIPTFPLLGSVWRCFRYHVGTLAFGALIIAIIQMIRIFLEYIDQKLKSVDNPVAKFVMCCLKCCFWCLEKFMRFINKNAYIMTAIYGKNFCVSAKNAFFLIIRNILRVAVVDQITDFVLFISKIVVTAAVTTIAYFLFNNQIYSLNLIVPDFAMNYMFVPVVVVAIGTFVVASLFFSVYSMGVDTLFLCFLEDLERHDGTPDKPYYMSAELMDIVGKKNKPEKEKTK